MGLGNIFRAFDHGERLLARHERHVEKIQKAATRRHDVVLSRLAALEDEHHVLKDLSDKLSPQK